MQTARTVALVLTVAVLVAWIGTGHLPAWLVVAAALAAVVFGTRARIRQTRLERSVARRVWARFND